jgi:hypothetical protein
VDNRIVVSVGVVDGGIRTPEAIVIFCVYAGTHGVNHGYLGLNLALRVAPRLAHQAGHDGDHRGLYAAQKGVDPLRKTTLQELSFRRTLVHRPRRNRCTRLGFFLYGFARCSPRPPSPFCTRPSTAPARLSRPHPQLLESIPVNPPRAANI